jgi:hypothetical protein
VERSKSGRRADESRYASVETISRPEGRSEIPQIRADVPRRCLCLLLAALDNPSLLATPE